MSDLRYHDRDVMSDPGDYHRDALLSDLLSMLAFFYRMDFHEYWGTSRTASPPHLEHEGLFSRAVELELAPELTAELGEMRDRALDLLSIWASVSGEGARARFSRLASCYLRGMHAEGLVMCRAVLEAALEESAPDGVVEAEGSRGSVEPEDRLAFLERGGALSRDGVERARRVRDAGGEALHPAPHVRPDPQQSVEDVAVVLDELERAGLLRGPA